MYFTVFGRSDIGRIDAKTGAVKTWPTSMPASQPRRGSLDATGKIWSGEFHGDKFGMFDIVTEIFGE